MTAPASAAALELTGISKQFGNVAALRDAHLAVRWGTVHGLLGENGAGKTTLMRIAFGLLQPDDGRLIVDGTPRSLGDPGAAISIGIGMVHQHFTNVPAMTVAENVALGRRGRYDAGEAANRVRELARTSGLVADPGMLAGELGVGAQQRLEILKALAREARILILDEPTAVLAPAEARELLAWLRGFADRGNAVVLITHKLAEALAVCDEVTVLRQGVTVVRQRSADTDAHTLAQAMIGEDASIESTPVSAAPGRVVIDAERVTIVDERARERISHATFQVRAGEIVGIAAVEGAGQYELLRAMAGRLTITTGRLERPAVVGFVPEDRHRDALVLDFSITENVYLRDAGRRRGVIHSDEWRARASSLLREYEVRQADTSAPVRSLSGGNQQRLVLGRELADEPAALVVENPTRGLDVRATQRVHQALRAAAMRGTAVVVYASDMDEVLALATRMLAVHAGTVRETALTREAVGNAMLGIS